MTDQYKDSYHKFYPQLLESLPMTDSRFRAALVQKRMFPGDLLNQVAAKDTRAEKMNIFYIPKYSLLLILAILILLHLC